MVVGRLQSHGHRTLSGAPATSADRWGSTVGALTCGASRLSGGAPDRSCRLSGAPPVRALTSARIVAHWMRLQSTVAREVAVAPLARRTVRCAPDSPVNYSGVPMEIPEGSEFGFECPGAPDTVRWHTGQSGAPDQGAFRVIFCSLIWTLFLVFLLAYCEPLAPVELID
jgi:hypothetical protein